MLKSDIDSLNHSIKTFYDLLRKGQNVKIHLNKKKQFQMSERQKGHLIILSKMEQKLLILWTQYFD